MNKMYSKLDKYKCSGGKVNQEKGMVCVHSKEGLTEVIFESRSEGSKRLS